MFNPYIVVPFAVWAIAQFIKFCLAAIRGELDFKYLYASGGMPSVHAAVVTSLATTAFILDGPKSQIFGLSVILAGIVMYDSFGVRRSSGEQAIAINQIIDSLDQKGTVIQPRQHLREVLGHTPSQVIVGAALGLAIAGLFNIDHLGGLLAALSAPVPKVWIYILAAKAAVLILGGWIVRVVLLRRYGQVAAIAAAVKQIYWTALGFGLAAGILAFLQYEKINAALWVIWPALLVALAVGVAIYFINIYSKSIPQAASEYRSRTDKQKWFEGPNKERRKKAAKKRK
jgi:acid phosphatase family membrane protein YuiD